MENWTHTLARRRWLALGGLTACVAIAALMVNNSLKPRIVDEAIQYLQPMGPG